MAEATAERRMPEPYRAGLIEPAARKARGKLLKSARKRTMILDAAAKVFAQRGYAATLNEIAEEAGTQAGSLYYYFASREQLVDEVIRIAMSNISVQVREAVEQLPPGSTWLEKIAVGFRAHVHSQLENHNYGLAYLKIIDQVPLEIQRRYLLLPRDYAIFWREIFEAAQAAGELHSDLSANVVRRLMFGAMNNALRWYDPRRTPDADEIADNVCQIFLYGLAAKSPRMGPGLHSRAGRPRQTELSRKAAPSRRLRLDAEGNPPNLWSFKKRTREEISWTCSSAASGRSSPAAAEASARPSRGNWRRRA